MPHRVYEEFVIGDFLSFLKSANCNRIIEINIYDPPIIENFREFYMT